MPEKELFVRSKTQVARFDPSSGATGIVMTKEEVIKAYGHHMLDEIDEHMSGIILQSVGAIEKNLKKRREDRGWTLDLLARIALVPVEYIQNMEADCMHYSVQEVAYICTFLGLNAARIGYDNPNA